MTEFKQLSLEHWRSESQNFETKPNSFSNTSQEILSRSGKARSKNDHNISIHTRRRAQIRLEGSKIISTMKFDVNV